ncbi:MAG: hypothetical protein GY795_08045 [Desulfobacterales bacterium]|nr:hypothetical protein [Desulfobacterales bacterium]
MNRFIFITVFITLVPATCYSLTSERFGDIKIEYHVTSEEQSSHGYFDYRITITNYSQTASHQVAITFPRDARTYGNSIHSLSRSVTVSAGSTVTFSMLQPPLPLSYSNKTSVYIDGIFQKKFLKTPHSRHCDQYYRMKAPMCILVSASVNRDDLLIKLHDAGLTPDLSKKSGYSEEEKIKLVRSELPTESWSMNWLSYSRFDGIILKNTELKAVPGHVKSALFSYVKCGGNILVSDDYRISESQAHTKKDIDIGLTDYSPGFGKIIVLPGSDISEITEEQLIYMNSIWEKSQTPWAGGHPMHRNAEAWANKIFPIVQNIEINIKGFLMGMFVFVILVGPVNFIILARKKKKIWMLWTIPVISLLTCACVFLYAIFSEGLDSDIKTSGITILDQASHEATTLGMTAFYCRLTPGNGLRFSNRTELTPMVSRGSDRTGSLRTVDWTTDQYFASGWVTSRVPAHFMVRKNETRRERVQISFPENGNPSAVNGLGAKIKKLWIADKQGRVFFGYNISAGSRAELKPTNMKPVSKTDNNLRNIYTAFLTYKPENIETQVLDYLVPNTYITILDGCPFIEKGLADPDNLDLDAIVFGILEKHKGKLEN